MKDAGAEIKRTLKCILTLLEACLSNPGFRANQTNAMY